jgi:hypothetical protein
VLPRAARIGGVPICTTKFVDMGHHFSPGMSARDDSCDDNGSAADGVTIVSGGAWMVKNTTSQEFIRVSEDPIAERAYEIYVERGGGDGSDWEDWFRAERELHAMRTEPRKRVSSSRKP